MTFSPFPSLLKLHLLLILLLGPRRSHPPPLDLLLDLAALPLLHPSPSSLQPCNTIASQSCRASTQHLVAERSHRVTEPPAATASQSHCHRCLLLLVRESSSPKVFSASSSSLFYPSFLQYIVIAVGTLL